MEFLKIFSIIILLIGFGVTVKNLYLILKGKIEYSLFYITLSLAYTIIPMVYIFLK